MQTLQCEVDVTYLGACPEVGNSEFIFQHQFKVLSYLKRIPGYGWVWYDAHHIQIGPDYDLQATLLALLLILFFNVK